jgi:hypothetical protein
MDFSLIKKRESGGVCYKLLKTNFYRNYFVIIAQDKAEFYCGSICSTMKEANALFDEIVSSDTDIYCVADILSDFAKQKV